MSAEHVVQPIVTENPQEAKPSETEKRTSCACGTSFVTGFGSVPGLVELYLRVRKGAVDSLHPLTRAEVLAQEYCGRRACAKRVEPTYSTPGTLRLMAQWGERNARKLVERDTLRYQREQAWKKRQLELAADRPDRGIVNRVLAEAGEKHGYHPKKGKKRLPMAERKLKAHKPKATALPDGGKKGKKKGKDENKKKGGKRGKK